MSVQPSSLDAASTSQVRLKDALLGGLMEEPRRDRSHQEEEKSEDSGNSAAEAWFYKEELVAQNRKAWEQPLTYGASSSIDQESKEYGSGMGPLFANIAGHIALHGSRLLHGQEDLWKTTRRSYVFTDSPLFGKIGNNLLSPGRSRFNGIRTTITSAN